MQGPQLVDPDPMEQHNKSEDTAPSRNKNGLEGEKEKGGKPKVVNGEKRSKSEGQEGGAEDGKARGTDAKTEDAPAAVDEPRDLWDEAYESLRKTNSKLVVKYEDVLFNSSSESELCEPFLVTSS